MLARKLCVELTIHNHFHDYYKHLIKHFLEQRDLFLNVSKGTLSNSDGELSRGKRLNLIKSCLGLVISLFFFKDPAVIGSCYK